MYGDACVYFWSHMGMCPDTLICSSLHASTTNCLFWCSLFEIHFECENTLRHTDTIAIFQSLKQRVRGIHSDSFPALQQEIWIPLFLIRSHPAVALCELYTLTSKHSLPVGSLCERQQSAYILTLYRGDRRKHQKLWEIICSIVVQ